MQKRVEFFGYILETGTIKPSTEKTKTVKRFPTPSTVRHVQSFLGLTGYFRKFIQGYAEIAKPLTDLLQKDKKFQFREKQLIAFNVLKKGMLAAPLLRTFQPDLPIELHTDASAEGFEAILLQKFPEDDKLHPVYYMSRKTTDA